MQSSYFHKVYEFSSIVCENESFFAPVCSNCQMKNTTNISVSMSKIRLYLNRLNWVNFNAATKTFLSPKNIVVRHIWDNKYDKRILVH